RSAKRRCRQFEAEILETGQGCFKNQIVISIELGIEPFGDFMTGYLCTRIERAKSVGMAGIARQGRLISSVSKTGIAPALEIHFSRCTNENDLKMDHQVVGR